MRLIRVDAKGSASGAGRSRGRSQGPTRAERRAIPARSGVPPQAESGPARTSTLSSARVLSPTRIEPWTSAVELRPSADPLPVADPNSRTPVLMHRPLLSRQVSRDVLSTIAATWRPTSRIAVEPLLADVVRLRPTTAIPRLGAPSFGAGLQVLVDLSDAMQPFRRGSA